MKRLLLLTLLYLLLTTTHASTSPLSTKTIFPYSDSSLLKKVASLSPQDIHQLTGHKLNFVQRLEWKILQKRARKKLLAAEDDSKQTISTIALITGIAGLVFLFVFPLLGFFLSVTGVVTGIIGINKNPNRKSYTKALIGMICGLTFFFLILLALALLAAGGFF